MEFDKWHFQIVCSFSLFHSYGRFFSSTCVTSSKLFPMFYKVNPFFTLELKIWHLLKAINFSSKWLSRNEGDLTSSIEYNIFCHFFFSRLDSLRIVFITISLANRTSLRHIPSFIPPVPLMRLIVKWTMSNSVIYGLAMDVTCWLGWWWC